MRLTGRRRLYIGLPGALLPLLAIAGPPAFQDASDAARVYSRDTRQTQYESLQGLPSAEIEYGPYGRLRSITGRTGIILGGAASLKDGDSGAAVLEILKPMLMATSMDSLRIRKVVHAFGSRTIFMDQEIEGIPVFDGGVNVRTSESGEIVLVSSLFVPANAGSSRTPQLSSEAAAHRLEQQLQASALQSIALAPANQARLAYWTSQGKDERPRLVWLLNASHSSKEATREGADYVVDATSGEVLHFERQAIGLNRTTYTLNYVNNLDFATYPGGLTWLWNEGSPNPNNAAANSIYTKVANPRNIWAAHGMQYETFGLVANYFATNSAWWGRNTSLVPFLVFGDNMAFEVLQGHT